MELNLNYNELLALIRQLPINQIAQLKTDITTEIIKRKKIEDREAFKQLILNGPVMTEEQYQQFKVNRKYFNVWRRI